MGTKESSDSTSQVVLEAVPLVLLGHHQPVECLTSDGHWLVSTCLAGNIKVWDINTGDLVVTISRTRLPKCSDVSEDLLYKELDDVCSDMFISQAIKPKPKIKNDSSLSNNKRCMCVDKKINANFPINQDVIADYEITQQDISGSEPRLNGQIVREGCESVNFASERTRSVSDIVCSDCCESREPDITTPNTSPIWCVDCQDNLIVVGCANGHIEVWEASTGTHKCSLGNDESGITCVRLVGHRIVAAKLNGSVDFYVIDWVCRNSVYRRTHNRTSSAGNVPQWSFSDTNSDSSFKCYCMSTIRAHQQPVTVLDFDGGRAVTGSQDHTLKVFSVADQVALFTLHGHFGPITTLFIDRVTPSMAGSGSQDGLLCAWDLVTGACMYSIQAHDGTVTCLTYSASYIISLGSDERLCVWERFQGHLLNTIQVVHTYCNSMVMLTHNLLITSRQGSLVVWDVCSGEPVRIVKLGHSDSCVFVHQIVLVNDNVVCDYGRQLRIVHFPMVHDKID